MSLWFYHGDFFIHNADHLKLSAQNLSLLPSYATFCIILCLLEKLPYINQEKKITLIFLEPLYMRNQTLTSQTALAPA